MGDINPNQLIERLKVLDAEETIIKSEMNKKLNKLNEEREQIKSDLKEYYYSVPEEEKEETKTLRFIKLGDAKLQEKILDPELVKDEEALLKFLDSKALDKFIKVIPAKKQPIWNEFKKEIKIEDNKATLRMPLGRIEVDGVTVKERKPKFEIKY